MEGCSPEEAKKHHLAMLLAFQKLGSDGGLDGGRIWLLVDSPHSQVHERDNTIMTIHKLLGFDVAKLKAQKIIKRYWKKAFHGGMGIGRGFIGHSWNGRERNHKYLRMKVTCGSHGASSAKAQSYLVTRKANEIEEAAGAVFNGKFLAGFIDNVFEKLAKRRGLTVFKNEGLQLTVPEIASVHDFCGLSSNKTFKLEQAIKVLRPQLKGVIFVPAMQKRID